MHMNGVIEIPTVPRVVFWTAQTGLLLFCQLSVRAVLPTQAGPSSTLQECSADGDLDGVKRLLNLGEDVDGIDEEGNTALHMAAECGTEDVVRFLVERGADANAVNDEGDSPLHKATISNFVNIIGLLVTGHADVNIQVSTLKCHPVIYISEGSCQGCRARAELFTNASQRFTLHLFRRSGSRRTAYL
jgi:ankyrin repeat protein